MRTGLVAAVVLSVAIAGCGAATDLNGAPNVKGLNLPDARAQLKLAGYAPSVTTDATFGVIIEGNFTVCSEKAPNGKLVPLKVNKNC
jgi:hypothetical protein